MHTITRACKKNRVAHYNGKLSHYRHASAKGKKRYNSYSFLTSTLERGEWSASRPGRFLSPGKDPGTHWIGGWMGLRPGLDTEAREKIPCLSGIERRSSSR
jgi:hypothetical protein